MSSHRWVAVAVIGAWLIQTAYLWPLPSQLATEMFASLGGQVSAETTDLEKAMWLEWAVRLFLIPVGVLAGFLLYRQNKKWTWVFLGSAAIYLVYFEVWIWLPFHVEPLVSVARVIDRASWIVGRPSLLFMTLLFPLFLLAVSVIAVIQLIRKRPHAL